MPVFEKPIPGSDGEHNYIFIAQTSMANSIRSYIRSLTRHTEYAKDGLPVLPPEQMQGLRAGDIDIARNRLTPEEEMILRDDRQEALKYAVKDRLVLASKPDPQALEAFIRLKVPDYIPLTEEEKVTREELSDSFRKKLAEYLAKREIVTRLTPVSAGNTGNVRTAQCLFKVGISDEDLEWNKKLADDLASDNTVVKKAAYARALIRIADDTDMTKLDLTSDVELHDNFEKYYSLFSSGPELASLIGEYKALGGNPDPEVEKRMEKLYAIYDAAGIMRAKVDVLASSVFSTVRTEQLYGNREFSSSLLLSDVNPETFIYNDNNPDKAFLICLNQITSANTLAELSSFFDKTKTPEQRLEDFYKDYRVRAEEERRQAEEERQREIARAEAKAAARNADIERYVKLDRIPEGLSPEQREKRIDYEIQLRKNIDLLNDAINAHNEKCQNECTEKVQGVINQYMTDAAEADGRLSGKALEDELSRLTKRKNDAVKALEDERTGKLINKLVLTEEKIQSYLTPERMALLERAAAVRRSRDERMEISHNIPNIPEDLTRIVFAHLKNPNEPGAEEYNRHIKDLLGGSDYDAQIARKQMIVDNVNTILSLDAEKLSFKKSFTEIADYALNNMDACMSSFEFQHIHRTMKADLGFSESKDLKTYMKNVESRGVVLGGRAQDFTNLLLDDSYMKLPFEALDTRQLNLLVNDAKSKPRAYGLNDPKQVERLTNFTNLKYIMDNAQDFSYSEPAKNTEITLSSFEDRHPDAAQLRQRLDEFENRLSETDHWYNRSSSSPEYREMRDAMQQLKTELAALTSQEGDVGRFQDARSRLVTAANSYISHVGDTPKNDNQSLRCEAAKKLKSFVTTEMPRKTVSAIIKSNALARPEDKAHYDSLMKPQSAKPAPKAENVPMQSGAAGELYDMLNSAKSELSKALQAPTPDPDLINHMAATVITCRMYEKKLGIAPPENNGNIVIGGSGIDLSGIDPADAKNFLGNEVISLMKSEAFKSALPKLDKEKLQELIMSEDAAKTEIMRDIYDGLSKQHKAPEAAGRSSEKSHSRQSDAPQKKGKALGK